ncbi:S8 family serine peptidase, partial [Fibrobacterota bacterium]
VIDDGFYLANILFRNLLASGRILDQWDFVDGDSISVIVDSLKSSHGANVLSVIGGEFPELFTGVAFHAHFLLYRAEDGESEYFVEEDFVAAAIERSVAKGARIINISLGYRYDFDTLPDHPYSYFDGRTGPASKAALGAAKRNVLVVASMGNEHSYHPEEPNMTSPADADSILSVGAMRDDNSACGFSSRGRTFDGRLKPEISAPGCPVPVSNSSTESGIAWWNGTSFAAPMVSGIAALVWQVNPAAHAQDIRQAITMSGNRSNQPDTIVGHGLVNAMRAIQNLLNEPYVNFTLPGVILAAKRKSFTIGILTVGQSRHKYFYTIKGQRKAVFSGEGLGYGDEMVWTPGHDLAYQVLFMVDR